MTDGRTMIKTPQSGIWLFIFLVHLDKLKPIEAGDVIALASQLLVMREVSCYGLATGSLLSTSKI